MQQHTREKKESHLVLLASQVNRLTNEKMEMLKQIESHEVKQKQLEEDLRTLKNELSSYRNNMKVMDLFNDLDLRTQLHENSTQDGHLIWKIDSYTHRKNEAAIGNVRALHSAPCFTSRYGYKYCLRVYLAGDGIGKGTHVSLFFVVMKSEYDELQTWPFNKKLKMCLINQQDRSKDIVENMIPNIDSSSFQKPVKEMNIASGCPLFLEINRLENEGFLKNDAFFIEFSIK